MEAEAEGELDAGDPSRPDDPACPAAPVRVPRGSDGFAPSRIAVRITVAIATTIPAIAPTTIQRFLVPSQ